MLNDNDFEEHTWEFVPATTAADTQKCIKLYEDWKRERNSLFPADKVLEAEAVAARGKQGMFSHSLLATVRNNSNLTVLLGDYSSDNYRASILRNLFIGLTFGSGTINMLCPTYHKIINAATEQGAN